MDMCKDSGKCGGDFMASNGFLNSPSYPDTYPNSIDCIYKISSPSGTFLTLKIEMFELNLDPFDKDKPCDWSYLMSDYLEIRDGGTENSPLIGIFCGTFIPSNILSTNIQVWMK